MRVVIADGYRTPVGVAGGRLSDLSASDLVSTLLRHMTSSNPLFDASIVDELILGEALSGLELEDPLQSVIEHSKLNPHTPLARVNADALSSFKAIGFARSQLLAEHSKAILAGGQESTSQLLSGKQFDEIAHYSDGHEHRAMPLNKLLGSQQPLTRLLGDRQSSGALSNAEARRQALKFSRVQLDQLTLEASKKAVAGAQEGIWLDVMVPIISDRGWVIEEDECVQQAITAESLIAAEPFHANGGTTVLNVARMADAAALLLMTTDTYSEHLGLMPIAEVAAVNSFPDRKALLKYVRSELQSAKNTFSPLPLLEIYDEFSVDLMEICHQLDIQPGSCNRLGGCLALGNPLGAVGAIMVLACAQQLSLYDKATALVLGRDARDRWMSIKLSKI